LSVGTYTNGSVVQVAPPYRPRFLGHGLGSKQGSVRHCWTVAGSSNGHGGMHNPRVGLQGGRDLGPLLTDN
jgi:hypothetical protein